MAEPRYDFRNWGRGRPDTPAQTPSQPTREQFDAAAKKVMASAPSGLSREQFFDLIDKELKGFAGSPHPEPPDLSQTTHEPDTWGGGFWQGIKREFTPGPELMKGLTDMATIRPSPTGSRMENLKEILPFLIPAGAEGALGAARSIKGQLGEIGHEAEALRGMGVGRLKSYAKATAGRLNDDMTLSTRQLQREPYRITSRFDEGPTGELAGTERSAAPPTGGPTENMSDLPLWKQQELMEAGGSAPVSAGVTRSQTPPVQPPSTPAGAAPRLAGTKAPKLEDVLNDVMQEGMGETLDPRLTSLPPESTTTGGGSFKQSGKFPKSEQVGQPGGYSSGRPSIGPEGYDELDSLTKSTREQVTGGGVDRDALVGQYTDEFVGGKPKGVIEPEVEDVIGTPMPEGEASPLDDILMQELDPGGMAGRAQDLRRLKGSRDAAREMFGAGGKENIDAIKTMAPGPSRTPLEATDRIEAARRKANDPLLGMLMAALGGHTARNLWGE